MLLGLLVPWEIIQELRGNKLSDTSPLSMWLFCYEHILSDRLRNVADNWLLLRKSKEDAALDARLFDMMSETEDILVPSQDTEKDRDEEELQNLDVMSSEEQSWIVAQDVRKAIEVYGVTGVSELTKVSAETENGIGVIGGPWNNSNLSNMGVIVTSVKGMGSWIDNEQNSGIGTITTEAGYGIPQTNDLEGFEGSGVVSTEVTEAVLNDWKMHLKMQNLTKNNSEQVSRC